MIDTSYKRCNTHCSSSVLLSFQNVCQVVTKYHVYTLTDFTISLEYLKYFHQFSTKSQKVFKSQEFFDLCHKINNVPHFSAICNLVKGFCLKGMSFRRSDLSFVSRKELTLVRNNKYW